MLPTDATSVYNMLLCQHMPEDINVNEAPTSKGGHRGAIQIAQLLQDKYPFY